MEYLKEFSHEVKTNCLYQFKFKFKGFKNFQIHSDNNAIQWITYWYGNELTVIKWFIYNVMGGFGGEGGNF